MNTDQLLAFVTVVEEGSFRSAASHLHKTQPTISAAINAIESKYEIVLFDREHYRPSLTKEGKILYRKAKSLLTKVSELDNLGYQLAQDAPPTISLTFSAMFSSPFVLDKVKAFCSAYPEVQVNINTEHLSGVLEQLQLKQADMAIGPRNGLDEGYEYIEISKISMVTVAVPGYFPLDDNGFVSQQLLRAKPHILTRDTGSMAPLEHMNLISGGQRWYVNDYQLKKALLIAGLGWARIPLHMVESQLRQNVLQTIKIEDFLYYSEVPMYLIRLRYQPMSELAKAFWEQMLPPVANSDIDL
ncbi:MAG: LysR family transcriptional regulator [Cellvibrionaceae bacterium]